MTSSRKYLFALIALFLSSCAPISTVPQKPGKIEGPIESKEGPTPGPSPAPASLALIYIPHPDGDITNILTILTEHPNLRMTLVFPPRYFEQGTRKSNLDAFRVLLSSQQIEIGLSLDNEPVLPLLSDLKLGGDKVAKWDFQFSWPEDAAYQIARGSAKYQKRWGELPSGFYPPQMALTEQVIESLRRFRLNWVIGKSSPAWGVKFFGAMALLISEPQPVLDEADEGSGSWAQSIAEWVFSHPYALVDGSKWENPAGEEAFLEKFAAMAAKKKDMAYLTAQEFTESLGEEYTLPKEAKPFQFDYSPWVSTNLQKRVWRALADARDVLDKYKNSGRANLQRLDAATEEMAMAENGTFLLSLSENQPPTDISERNFLATLSNIYRLCNVPVAANINNLFVERSFQKTLPKPSENDRPFFVEGAQSLTWNDPAGDDNGAGQYTYPSGRYPKGSFDLRELTLEWNDSVVTFSVTLVGMPALNTSVVVPMADIYIDINKFIGAGSTAPLRKRTATLINKEAAWEYAVSLTPNNSSLVQSVPGGDPRLIRSQRANVTDRTFAATFSRDLLRGDPRNWRISMGVAGTENSRKTDEILPISIMGTAGERNFGGGAAGRSAPSYIDVLAPSADEQRALYGPYESGSKIILFYTEPK